MKKIIFYTGFTLFFLGASSLNSEKLVIPMVLSAIGLILMGLTKEVVK